MKIRIWTTALFALFMLVWLSPQVGYSQTSRSFLNELIETGEVVEINLIDGRTVNAVIESAGSEMIKVNLGGTIGLIPKSSIVLIIAADRPS